MDRPELGLAVEVQALPVLLESGDVWGLSLGWSRRQFLVPERVTVSSPDSFTRQVLAARSAFDEDLAEASPSPSPGWRWFWGELDLSSPPLLACRSTTGLEAAFARKHKGVTIGRSALATVTPENHAFHLLSFSQNRPNDNRAVVIYIQPSDPRP